MQGIEKSYVNIGILAVITAMRNLFRISVGEACLKRKYGKTDTRGMDAVPEINIKRIIKDFFIRTVLVTEETDNITTKHWPQNPDPDLQPLMFFSDPFDRSNFFANFLKVIAPDDALSVGEIVDKKNATEIWVSQASGPIAITGPTISISCVSKGSIIFSATVNVITKTLFVACQVGAYYLNLPDDLSDKNIEKIDLNYIIRKGKKIIFPPAKKICKSEDDLKRFVTFLGKEGYKENLDGSMIFLKDPHKHLHYDLPGGPSRILYLSDFQKQNNPIGFIIGNGEKIGEWIHWLPYVKYVKNEEGEPALRIFEVKTKTPLTKDSILMCPPPPYSVFRVKKGESPFFNLSRLRDLDSPSHYRSMIIVVPFDNEYIVSTMIHNGYHDVSESL